MTGTIKKIITFSITFLVLFLSFNFLYTHYINSSRAIYRTELEFRQYKENTSFMNLVSQEKEIFNQVKGEISLGRKILSKLDTFCQRKYVDISE